MWTSLFCLTLCCASNDAFAGDSFPLETVANACFKEQNLELCRNLNMLKKNTEKTVNKKLKELGLVNSAVIVGTVMKYAVDQKVEFKSSSDWSPIMGSSRSIVLSKDTVMVMFVWPMEW